MKIPLLMGRGIFTRRRINNQLHDFRFCKKLQNLAIKWHDKTNMPGGWSGSSFLRIYSYLFVRSEIFIRIASNQPCQSCKEDGSGPFYQYVHLCSIMYEYGFVFCKSAQLLSGRGRMMLHLHDADPVKGYERKLTKRYECGGLVLKKMGSCWMETCQTKQTRFSRVCGWVRRELFI